MAKLTYWCARQDEDHQCYNIRTKTKKECLDKISANSSIEWSKPFKVTIEYNDAFHLLTKAIGEGGISEYPEV